MDVVEGFLTASDGTRVATYQAGRPDGPVLVLTHGLGGSIAAWKHLIDHLGGRFRFLSWDYRGLYRSCRPPDGGTPESYAMRRHCEDCLAFLDSEGVDRAVFVGWSMGVQVNLELYRSHPERFLGMVLINGTSGRIFETAFRGDWLKKVAPIGLDFFEESGPLIATLGPAATRTRAFIAVVKALGLCSPTLDEDVFLAIAQDFVRLDFRAYGSIFRELGLHDADDVLPSLKVPLLAVTGEKDLFTPIETSERIVAQVPGAELTVVPGGTHYTPIEYPMIVNLRIERFLKERLGLPAAAAASPGSRSGSAPRPRRR
ncbi:MAG: alpha/beta hydrolase [Deltaproteobacteria bacterium]|nr:alpha/beta hydrolase [Deltaproteobacteria bacterium]